MQKNIPQLRFPEFNGELKKMNGNEIFDSISNKKHDSNLPILAISQEFGAIPREMLDLKISVSEKSIDSYKVVEKGDFIISLRSFQGGIEYSEYTGICSPAYIILKPKITISSIYYKYYLKTSRYINELNKKLEGIRDGKMISYSYFSDILISYPSISEQQKIASFITSVDEKLQALKKKKTLLEQYKKGVMQKLFSKELRFKDENGKDFPDWEEKKLGEVCDIVIGGTPSTTNINYWNGNIGWIGSGELKNGLIKKPTKYITDLGLKKSSTTLMPRGTTVLAMTGATLGKIGYLDIDCAGNQSVAGFINLKEMNSKFLFFQMQIISNQILTFAGGAAQAGINKSNIEALLISVPSHPEQTRIAKFLTSIDDKINHINQQILKTDGWKKGLLQKMFV